MTNSTLVLETRIDTITGLRSYVTTRFPLKRLIATLVLILIGFVLVGMGGLLFTLIGIVAMICGVVMTVSLVTGQRRGAVTIQVFAGQASTTPVSFGNNWSDHQTGRFRRMGLLLTAPFAAISGLLGRYDAFDLLFGVPGPGAVTVANELGALIADIQSKGDLAAPHWAVNPEPLTGE